MISLFCILKLAVAVVLVVLVNTGSATANVVGREDSSIKLHHQGNGLRRQLQKKQPKIKPTTKPVARTTRPPTKSVSPIIIIIDNSVFRFLALI
jgi:hypothetical protein